MTLRRSALVLAAAVLLLAASAPAGLAKEGGIARLDAPIPLDAPPGSTITVGWAAVVMDGTDESPIQGSPLFIRLIPPAGAAVEAGGVEDPPGSGHYVATLVVPAGGIARFEIGLRGESCTNGACERSDWLLTIADTPSGYPAPAAPVAVGAPGGGATGPAGAPTAAGREGSIAPVLVIAAIAVGVALLVGIAATWRRRTDVAHP